MVWVHETLFNILHSRISEPCWTYNPPSRLLLDDWNFLVCEEKRRKRSLFYPSISILFFFLSFFLFLFSFSFFFIDISKSRMTEALYCILFIRVGDYEIWSKKKKNRNRSQYLGKSFEIETTKSSPSLTLKYIHSYHSLRSFTKQADKRRAYHPKAVRSGCSVAFGETVGGARRAILFQLGFHS